MWPRHVVRCDVWGLSESWSEDVQSEEKVSGLSTVWTFHYFCAAGRVGESCPSSLRLLLTGETFETRPDDAAGPFSRKSPQLHWHKWSYVTSQAEWTLLDVPVHRRVPEGIVVFTVDGADASLRSCRKHLDPSASTPCPVTWLVCQLTPNQEVSLHLHHHHHHHHLLLL